MAVYGGGFQQAFVQVTSFYFIIGSLLHFVVPRILPVKHIQKQQRGPHDVLRDAVYSLGPLAVKAGVWTIVEKLHAAGATLLYDGSVTSLSQVLYMLLTVVVLDVLHDAWFYWTHRLLHCRMLYKHVHYIHHRSKAPSAFTGYSFHVIEAFIVFANEIIVCFLFPIHMSLHRVYHLFTTAIHEGGHAGYEMAPFIPSMQQLLWSAVRGMRTCSALNTVQHHDLHHQFPTKHFSLYFTHWDRLMGTLHPQYDAQLFTYSFVAR